MPSAWAFNVQGSLGSEGGVILAAEGLHGLLHWVLRSLLLRVCTAEFRACMKQSRSVLPGFPRGCLWGVRGARDALVWGLFVFNTRQEWLHCGNETLDENPGFCQGLFDVGTRNCDFCLQVQKMNVTPLNQVVKCHVSLILFSPQDCIYLAKFPTVTLKLIFPTGEASKLLLTLL